MGGSTDTLYIDSNYVSDQLLDAPSPVDVEILLLGVTVHPRATSARFKVVLDTKYFYVTVPSFTVITRPLRFRGLSELWLHDIPFTYHTFGVGYVFVMFWYSVWMLIRRLS